MKYLYQVLYSLYYMLTLQPLFNSDRHHIVSRKGWELLEKNTTYIIMK